MAKKFNTINRSLKTGDLINHSNAAFKTTLDESLKKSIAGALNADEELTKSIDSLPLDSEALKNKSLVEVIEGIKDMVDAKHLDVIGDYLSKTKEETNTPKVNELLGFDVPLAENPLLSDALLTYNASKLGKLIKLNGLNVDTELPYLLNSSADQKTLLLEQWKIEKKWSDADVAKVGHSLDLYRVLDKQADWVVALSANGIEKTADLAFQNPDTIKKVLTDAKVSISDEAEFESFTNEVMFTVEREYPSAYFMHRVVEKPEWLGIDVADKPKVSDSFKTFYSKNKDFDIKNEPIISLETGLLNEKIKDIDASPELISELSMAQQALQISPDTDIAALLMAKNVHVYKAVNTTRNSLMRELDIDADTASQIKEKAQSMHDVTMNGFLAYRDIHSNPFVKNVLANLSPAREAIFKGFGKASDWEKVKVANGLKDLNSFEDLFGSQNYCECESCQSVLSPAAYFVDLMSFIEKRVLKISKGGNGISENILEDTNPIHLKVRRPDLWQLPLTCENTNKDIPYIEVVNEVLTAFVEKQLGANPAVSKRLLDEKPGSEFLLPYNHSLEEVRTWLSYFGIHRIDLLEYLYETPGSAEKLDLVLERLNLSPETYNIIIDGNLDAEIDNDVLKFRVKSGLSPDETELLTNLLFWNNGLEIKQIRDDSDIQKFQLKFKSTIKKWKGKIHRIIRLWRATGWSLTELDIALQSFTITHENLDSRAIQKLALFKEMQEKTGFKVEILSGVLLGVSKTSSEKKSLTWEHLLPLGWDNNRSVNIADLQEGVDEKAVKMLLELQGIFGVDAQDILDCFSFLVPKTSDPIVFSVQNLDLAFRYIQLYKWTKATDFAEFAEVLRIWDNGQNKFLNLTPVGVLSFIDFVNDMPLSPENMVFILGKELMTTAIVEDDKTMLDAEPLKAIIKNADLNIHIPFELFFNQWLGIESVVLTYFRLFTEVQDNKLKDLFTDLLSANPADDTYIQLSNIKHKLERLKFLFEHFKIDAETLGKIAVSVSSNDIFRFGFSGWMNPGWIKEMSYLGAWLKETRSIPTIELIELLCHLNTTSTATLADHRALAKWKAVSLTQVQAIWQQSDSILEIQSMLEQLAWMKKLNMNAESLRKFKLSNSLSAQSELIQHAIRSKYEDNDTWEKAIQDSKNVLSSKYRDALCSFVIHHSELVKRNFGFSDRESLYQYFLLDVSMGDCFTLPKLVIATNSLQVYIHRCIMGLERSADEKTSVLLDIDEIQEWEWRKNYRVWEANRKIYLYPENYAEAAIRDNKSPEFKELEDELLQQKLDLEVVENAYKKYLEQIMTLAELRIAGAYYDKSSSRIYLFGRTNKQPMEYYYRNLEFLESGGVIWSNWEKMNIAVPTEDVSAVMYNGKLHVFWTTTQRKDISSVKNGNSTINKYTYDVFLNYSYLMVNNKWSPPQKVAMGHRTNSPFDAFLRIEEYNSLVDNPTSSSPKLKDDSEAVRENALKEFETTVYRKPYPLITNDKKILKFGYIWTDQKEAVVPRYKYSQLKVDAFSVSVKIKLVVGIITVESDIEFNLDRIDKRVSGPNQTEAPVSISIAPITYHFDFGNDRLSLIIEFSKKGTGEYGYVVKTSGNGGNSMFFWKEPNKEIKNGDAELHHQIDYVPVSSIQYRYNDVDMANQKMIRVKDKTGLTLNENQFRPEYINYFDNFANFFVTTGDPSFANESTAMKIQQKDFVSVLTTQQKSDPNNGYNLNPGNIQMLWDQISVGLEEFMNTEKTQRHLQDQVDYSLSFGNYFYELFFHIPMRIADHLNASGKFREANYWYGFIYNPTAIKDKFEQLAFPTDVNWRFVAFRNQTAQKLREIYSNPDTIEMYRRYPGNPHAIARLRAGAYPKHVVMKYLDNLMDWADNLFEQFTPESTSEARHLYSVVKTILGDKPQSTGSCGDVKTLTYSTIKDSAANEFIINLFSAQIHAMEGKRTAETVSAISDTEGIRKRQRIKSYSYKPSKYSSKNNTPNTVEYNNKIVSTPLAKVDRSKVANPRVLAVDERYTTLKPINDNISPVYPTPYFNLEIDLAFCFPHNKDLLNYWDRVNDRIYKLNHCLDINGVKKEMAAYAPEIDPMLLARMVAGGLSFDEIIGALNARLPYHRFVYLIEKAKQYTSVVQGFGQSLFSAIEKKDAEELTLLRARHEQNILSLTTKVKKRQVEQAQTGLKVLLENKKGIEIKKAHYESLIEEDLIPWERAEQIAKWTAGGLRVGESVFQIAAAITALAPQVGSPFSMKYGGVELSKSSAKFAGSLDAIAKMADNIAILAGMEASHQRRAQEWQFQVTTASQELVSINQQIRNAEIALVMAETDLEIHEKNIEQYQELYEFYTTKFTGYNHYTFHVRQMQQLYRMAYNLAYEAAMQAQRAFAFERQGMDVTTDFIKNDNWNNEKLGLLAGERLNLQLMQLEQEFTNTDKRKLEITQHFSMLQIAPDKLMELKINGECNSFEIPEAAFDLVYPGQYRRIIKSVRISIPCIAGPYTNIGATLTLEKSHIRSKTTESLNVFNFSGCGTIATSSAQNDGGQFELNFRDEKYLPFEGAGAISSWTLSLPKTIRPFDYNTISDVIFHISYTAEYDAVYKNTVETGLSTALNNLNGSGMLRVFSMRHDFPLAWNQLNSESNSIDVLIELKREHFPYFATITDFDSIASKSYTQNNNNEWNEELTNLGVSKTGLMKITIPVTLKQNNLKDFLFLVKYKC